MALSTSCVSKALRWLALVACVNAVVVPVAQAQVVMATRLGNSLDPLVGAFPLFAAPGETRFSEVTIANNPFNQPQVTARVRIGVRCCTDSVTGNSVAPPGISLRVTPFMCRDVVLASGEPTGPVDPPQLPPGPPQVALPLCPSLADPSIDLTPTSGGSVFLRLVADGSAAPTVPGGLTATVVASWTQRGRTVEVTLPVRLSIVPRVWPADGTPTPCAPGLTVVPLGAIRPNPYDIKRANLALTSLTIGAAFDAASPAAGGGLNFVVGPSPTPNLIAPGTTTVTFTNSRGWPVGIRAVNSRNCSAQGSPVVVPAGQTRTLRFSTSNTTTLVFSKSTCRAWINAFDCWGQSALGMDDIVALSEGPFWLLFGNHQVDLTSVGDWGAMRRPDSVAIIRTP